MKKALVLFAILCGSMASQATTVQLQIVVKGDGSGGKWLVDASAKHRTLLFATNPQVDAVFSTLQVGSHTCTAEVASSATRLYVDYLLPVFAISNCK